MKKIYYLWLRQLKKYWRSKPRLIGTLAQPIVFLLMFGYGFGGTFSAAGGNYLDFLVPGIIGMSIIFTAIFTGMEVIWDRQFGFLKETLVGVLAMSKVSMTMDELRWIELEKVILSKAKESSFKKEDFAFLCNFFTAIRLAMQAKETFGDWEIPKTWCVVEYIKDKKITKHRGGV